MKSLLAAILLAGSVTCCLAYENVAASKDCADYGLPESLKNETVSKLHMQYKDYLKKTNTTMMGCKEITVLDILAHALNTTGNMSATIDKLRLSNNRCMEYFKFSLKEVAFQNLKDPDKFPGKTTLNDLIKNFIFTNTTENVLKEVQAVIKGSFKNKTLNVTHTIHELTKEGHLTHQSKFFLVMCFAINASSFDQAAKELRYPKELLNVTVTQMAEYLYTSVNSFKRGLSLECAIRHLHSAKNWLLKLGEFLKRERLNVHNKTVDDLFMEKNKTKNNTAVLSLLKEVFPSEPLNMTFLQFFGTRRVSLELSFSFTVAQLEKMTFVNADVICNYTLEELFNFAFIYSQLIDQYKMNIQLAMTQKELILLRYNATMYNLTSPPFNLTSSEIKVMTDIEFENHVIRFFLSRYAMHKKLSVTELETRSEIMPGQLENATVYTFVSLLYNISKTNIFLAIKEQEALAGIIVDTSSLFCEHLLDQIKKERTPYAFDSKIFSKFSISYHIFQEKLDPTKIYNITFYDFIVKYVEPYRKHSFRSVLNDIRWKSYFMRFTFLELRKSMGLHPYEIYKWTITDFMDMIINDKNQCDKHPCKNMTGVTCINHPDHGNHPRGFTCRCPANKNLDPNKLCADINECTQKPAPHCRNHSHCVNTVGSYECKCNMGFEDINGNCTDIHECNIDKHKCHKHANCTNHHGGYTCKCNTGYEGDGFNCTDINECKTKPCHNNSDCTNTEGSHICKCKDGFEDIKGNNNCTDINECEKDSEICYGGVNVNCTNTIGSFHCDCKKGFRFLSEERICDDINECRESEPCRDIDHSLCKNIDGSYECECPSGFNTTHKAKKGNLHNCTDINECQEGKDNCHKHATCKNSNGTFSCKCNEGYKGDGVKCKADKLFESCPTGELTPRGRHGKVETDLKFYYNEEMHKKLYISSDGTISIGKRHRGYRIKKLESFNKDLLAPFWAITGYSANSSVKYCELVQDDQKAAPLLDKINKFVANSTNEDGFEASFAIVVTWREMIPYQWWRRIPLLWFIFGGRYSNEKNTFQAAIASNGTTTVVVFLYEDEGMNWFRVLNRAATVGFSRKGRDNKGEQVKGSFSQSIFNIDQQKFTDPAGNVRKGCWVRVFKDKTTPKPTPEDNCLSWVRKESKKSENDHKWPENLPRCPCTQQAIRFDRRFRWWYSRNGAVCYLRRRKEKTKSCCYDVSSGALITKPDHRAGRVLRYSPTRKLRKYNEYDLEPFNWCCKQSNKYCGNFYELRPADDTCSEEEEPQECTCRFRFGFRRRRVKRRPRFKFVIFRTWFFGDPHISTLDGFKYTFNGLGDFVMLKTKDKADANVIHAQTKRPPHKDGGFSKATVFDAFAMRSSLNTTVQVFYDSTTPGNLNITTLNQSMHCQNFGINMLDKHPIDGFQLSNQSTTLVVLFDSGLTAEITPGMDLLQIAINIPADDFENKTMGLLGTLNDDKTDDLTFRNGTTIPISSTDKQIFEYAKDWAVQDHERLFMNRVKCDKQVVFSANFTPLFLSDLKDNITDRMRTVCKNNTECLLDYLVTGDETFASATLKFETENEKIKKIFDNRPPSITASPKVVEMTVGKETTVNVLVTDPDKNDTIVSLMILGLPDGAVFNNDSVTKGVLKWTPVADLADKEVNIRFIAKDKSGAAALFTLNIRYCDCNSGSGNTCDFATIQKSTNSSLQLVGCNCTEQFTGDQCETTVDPCQDDPCYENVNCTKNFTNNPSGIQCGPCPKGLEGDGKVCNDFDECLNASRNNCTESEKCVNKIGSFKCDCKPGYRRNPITKKCDDIDECAPFFDSKCKDNTDCTNTPGSYNCSCKKGYEGKPLEGCTDINECFGDSKICYGIPCNNTVGSFVCKCSTGFKLVKEGKKLVCRDIDECKFPIDNYCMQNCKNSIGSFKCACKPGFQLDSDKRSCSVAEDSKCDKNTNICEHLCTKNSTGATTCHCRKGYQLANDKKKCEDINECLNTNSNGCHQLCSNNYDGTYNCSCKSGFSLKDDKRTCEDINECSTNKGGCGQKCRNTAGGRDCYCKKGYKLKTSDNTACEDIDECRDDNICLDKHRTCFNKPGGYRCSCSDRRMFSDGTFKCKRARRFIVFIRIILVWIVEYEDEYSPESISLRLVVVRKLNAVFKLKFKTKYFGCTVGRFRRGSVLANVTVNFDSNSNVTASDINSVVSGVNDLGGLKVNGSFSKAQDLDECSDPSLNNCHKDATCKNEVGTFNCSCNKGYKGDGFSCNKEPEPVDDDKKIMIILLCVLIPLAVIIIIIIIWCCVKRRNKGNLHMDEDAGVQHVHMRNTMSSNGHYGNEYGGRRGSDDSNTGHYDIAEPSTFKGKETTSGMYDVSHSKYYDNPAVTTEGGTKEASL